MLAIRQFDRRRQNSSQAIQKTIMLLSALSILNHCYRSREVQKQVVHVNFLYQIKSIQPRLKLRRKRSNGRLCSQCCNDTIQPTQRFVINHLLHDRQIRLGALAVAAECKLAKYAVIVWNGWNLMRCASASSVVGATQGCGACV
jgi:hypothetical protein